MATLKFSARSSPDASDMIALVEFILASGFEIKWGSRAKLKREVERALEVRDVVGKLKEGGYFFLFPTFEPIVEMEVVKVDNIHEGVMYVLRQSYGGPYVDFKFTGANESGDLIGEFLLRPHFWITRERTARPSDGLRLWFKKLRSELIAKRMLRTEKRMLRTDMPPRGRCDC